MKFLTRTLALSTFLLTSTSMHAATRALAQQANPASADISAHQESVQAIVIDAGATNTRIGYWNGTEVSNIKIIKTPHYRMPALQGLSIKEVQQIWIETLTQLVYDYHIQYPFVQCVSIGFPGPVDANGTIVCALGLWTAQAPQIPKTVLEKHFDLPVVIADDVRVAVLRYAHDQRYQHCNRVALFTVSSGIAIKCYDRYSQRVMVDGKGRGGAIGCMQVDDSNNRLTGWAISGDLSSYASGIGIINLARRLARENAQGLYKASILNDVLTSTEGEQFNVLLIDAYKKDDPFAHKVITTSIDYVAKALSHFILLTTPDIIVLTGGFAQAVGDSYRTMLVSALQKRKVFGFSDAELEAMIQWDMHDDLNGLIGAGMQARDFA